MEYLVLSLVAFFTAILTFFSGFGLGTILTPAFMLFFPVELAIALTGVVHFFNNIFKLILVGRQADRQVLLRFGVPAVLAAVAGAWLLLQITDWQPLFSYLLFGKTFEVFPVKFIIAILLIILCRRVRHDRQRNRIDCRCRLGFDRLGRNRLDRSGK